MAGFDEGMQEVELVAGGLTFGTDSFVWRARVLSSAWVTPLLMSAFIKYNSSRKISFLAFKLQLMLTHGKRILQT